MNSSKKPHGAGRRALLAALAMAGLGATQAQAQAPAAAYPSKPIRMVVAWPPGGTTDAAARILAQRLNEKLGAPVVVDNKSGANGRIGAESAAKSPADGYTLFFTSAETHVINQHVYQRVSYDAVRDFVAIAPFAVNAFAITSRLDFPAKNVKELISLAKASPGKLTFASWGIGSTSHIGMETFKVRTGIDMLHIPFQGESPALNALMGGQVDLMMLSAAKAEQLRKEGKVKVYGATTAARYFAMPETATLKEEGLDITVANWFGLTAPAGTPPAIVNRIAAEVAAAVKAPEVLSQLRAIGLDAAAPTVPADFDKFIAAESTSWGNVIRSANIRLD